MHSPGSGPAALVMGLQTRLPYGSLPAPKTTPKPPWGLWQRSSGAVVGHPLTPGRWEGVPLIPCPLTKWDEGTDVLGWAVTHH